MAATTKNTDPPAGVSRNVRMTRQGREALDRITERMGWEIGRAASACAVRAESLSDEELLAAMRELGEQERAGEDR